MPVKPDTAPEATEATEATPDKPKRKRTRQAASCKASQDGYACALVPNHAGRHVDMERLVMWLPGPVDAVPMAQPA